MGSETMQSTGSGDSPQWIPFSSPYVMDSLDLSRLLCEIRSQLAVPQASVLRMIVSGSPRAVRPQIAEQVYKVVYESLFNAFRHSGASHVEVEISYGSRHLGVQVRDNGAGIDTVLCYASSETHRGLRRMREIAELVNAKLRILSHPAAGTEIELSIPAQVAFEAHRESRFDGWLSKFYSGQSQDISPNI